MVARLTKLSPDLESFVRNLSAIFELVPKRMMARPNQTLYWSDADSDVLRKDWMNVSNDLWIALINTVGEQDKTIQRQLWKILAEHKRSHAIDETTDTDDLVGPYMQYHLDFFTQSSPTEKVDLSLDLEDAK